MKASDRCEGKDGLQDTINKICREEISKVQVNKIGQACVPGKEKSSWGETARIQTHSIKKYIISSVQIL